MRASVLALAAASSVRQGKGQPDGAAVLSARRPIDLHLKAFEQLGAVVSLESGDVVARALRADSSATRSSLKRTVTGTENVRWPRRWRSAKR